jgi:hypothetical protein
MRHQHRHIALITLLVLIIAAVGFRYKLTHYQKVINKTTEEALKVNLDAGYGEIRISRGSSDQILNADINADLKNDLSEYIDYENRDNLGYLDINTTEPTTDNDRKRSHSIKLSGFEDNSWDMHFTDAIPISFDIELGMGKGEFDFSGMQIKDLNLSTGASSVSVRFAQPNPEKIENMTIETGLSKFKGYGLCNANFEKLKFQGGVGSYYLDFSGKLENEVSANLEVGLGSLTISVPKYIGVQIYYEKSWIASIDLPDGFDEEEENTYYSQNYSSAEGKIDFHIEAGLGSVKIIHE